jgi:hypothetical protein
MTSGTEMKEIKAPAIPWVIACAVLSLALAACNGSQGGNEGNMHERMAIYSLISLTVFAVILVSFGGGRRRGREPSGVGAAGQSCATYPLSAPKLTGYPVYVWDYRSSFHKIVFHPDGVFSKSSGVSSNGLDPTAKAAGSWDLTPDGKLRITPRSAGAPHMYTRISGHGPAVLMRPDLGLVEAWYMGPGALACIQISIFGNSASVPATMRFSTALVSGRIFYGATYPCLVVTTSGEVVADYETTCGLIAFHSDGTLAKSVDNRIGSVPDYAPLITGTWSVDDGAGSLTMTVSGFRTTAFILGPASEEWGLLIGTTTGNRLWFPDHERAPARLADYLSEAVRLVPRF